MGDFKSKLPDLQELGSMTGKLYKGIKTSIQEIICDYKKKREEQETKPSEEASPSSPPVAEKTESVKNETAKEDKPE